MNYCIPTPTTDNNTSTSMIWVTPNTGWPACMENLEMSGNLTAVRDFTENQGIVRENILTEKFPKLLIVNCIFVSI